jgi:hypothetical protein
MKIITVKKMVFQLLFVIMITIPAILSAQLSGVYTIGSGQDFETFSAAVKTLNEQGISGPVTFNVISGVYNTHFVIEYVDGASETNTITFQSQARDSSQVTIRYTADNADSNYVVKLKQCRYVTIRDMTFEAGGERYSNALIIEYYATGCTISNNSFEGFYDTNGYRSESLIYGDNSFLFQLTDLAIKNNRFSNGSYGIYIHTGSNHINRNPEISGNTFDHIGQCALYFSQAQYAKIAYNTIQNCGKGMELRYNSYGAHIYNNKIYNFSQTGMKIFNSIAGQAKNSYVFNNIISGGPQGSIGVEIRSSDYLNFFNNSIRINFNYSLSRALMINNGTNIKIVNNIISIMQKGIALYVESASSVTQCDYNAYYSPDYYLAYWDKNCEDLRTLKNESGDNAHSMLVFPNFSAEYDLHVNSAWLDGAGSGQFNIMDDIDGEARNNPPDIGADEFTATADVQPPLSGIRTIGSGQDYNTLEDALNDVNLKGLSDSLVLQISPGNYIGHYEITPISGASSKHPLIIESFGQDSSSVNLQWQATDRNDSYIFHLNGASFVKFRHLSFESFNASYCRVLHLEGMVDSLYVEHCRLTGREQTNFREECALIYGKNINFHHQFIISNSFNSGALSIYEENNGSYSSPGKAFIKNNRIKDAAYQAFYLSHIKYPSIENNHIESKNYGISVHNVDDGLLISHNYILAPYGQTLRIGTAALGINSEHSINNNFIMADNASKNVFSIAGCSGLSIYYNSISANINDVLKLPLRIYGCSDIDLRNNIFSNKGTGYSVYIATSSFTQADYNCYYSQGLNLGFWDQECADLAAIRSASSANEHSIQSNPIFTAYDDLHASSTHLDGAAVHIDGMDYDLDGDFRNPTAPDIGADEFYSGTQNPPHRIAQIPDQVFPEDCGTQTIVNDLNTIFEDDPADMLTFSASSADMNISPVIVNNSTLNIVVTENFNGDNIAVYVKAADLAHQAVYDTFLVSITPMPEKPVANDDHVSILYGNTLDIYPLRNDYDPDGLELIIFDYSQPQHGTVGAINDTMMRYEPQAGFTGVDSFIYVAGNSAELSDTAAVFIEISDIFSVADSSFYGISNGSALWGDYDNDKDLDLLVFGLKNNQNENINILYKNTDGVFTEATQFSFHASLQPDNLQGAAWGDVNNDGNLDLLIAGKISGDPFSIRTRLYVNNHGSYFREYQTDIFDAWGASITWVDYDNDGDQDVLIAGNKSSDLYDPSTKLYRNDGGGDDNSWIFTDVTDEQFPDLCYACAAWADYDNDGDQDLLLCGSLSSSSSMMDIFINDNGSFSALELPLTNINYGKVIWGDYDADGDLDILFSGRSNTIFSPACGIYRNDGNNVFTLQTLPGTSVAGDAAWIDYDNDGDLDIALCGRDSLAGKQFKLFNNSGGSYTEAATTVPKLTGGMAWGDYNNDGKADLCITGINQAGKRRTVLLRNNCINTNLPPETPHFAGTNHFYNLVGLRWHPPQDDHTPSQSITYNIMVGEVKNGVDIVSPASHTDDGYRKIVFSGNVGTDTSYIINGLVSGKLYYFAVQAVDGAYSGSPFYSRGVTAYADDFMEIEHSLPDVSAKLASADMNKDGRMDLVIYGEKENYNYFSRVYKRGAFDYSELDYTIRTAKNGSLQWQDYDGDGDADMLLSGFDINNNYGYYFTSIAEFKNYQFEEQPYDLFGTMNGDARWGDYDNDGDEDVLIIGKTYSSPFTKLFENRDSVFYEVETDFRGYSIGSIDWGDYDNDGDLDVLITGYCPDAESWEASDIYRNDNGTFTRLDAGLPGVRGGKGIWGDYDADGDLDILLCGEGARQTTTVCTNNSGSFTILEDSLIGITHSAVKWADLNNDGFLDIIGNGLANDSPGDDYTWYSTSICYIFNAAMPLGHGGHFQRLDTWLGGFYDGDITVADIDGDLDLDIIQCGKDENRHCKTRVFRNRANFANYPPVAPANLSVTETDSSYIFSWDKASDDKTPQKGLTYNLRIGSAPGASDIKPCNSDTSGYHFVPIFGNVGEGIRWELKNPPTRGSIYWSVQTIDNNFVGSPFAPEQHITITSVKNTGKRVPEQFALLQNYPNPFNPSTTIKYQLAKNSMVELSVYNVLGEKVAVLVNEKQQPGSYSVRFDAAKFSSGIYFYRIKADNFMRIRKMVFIR